MKFANRMAAIASALLCVFGIIITVMLLFGAAKARPFDWYRFIPALLYILCFAALLAYSMVSLVPSKVAFPAVLATYGLVVLVTGIIYPPIYPHGMKYLFVVLSALIILGLAAFNWTWADVKQARLMLTFAFAFELFASVTGLFVMLDYPMAEYSFVDKAALFIRPIILGAVAVCYLTRMYEKSLSEKEK
jgi:hypothetical protein